jgi:hypothetical protein
MRARLVIAVSALTCLAAFVAALFLSYRAGCAGDLKSGTWGDFNRAFQLEEWAMRCLFFGWLAGLLAACWQATRTRKVIGVLMLVPLAPALWIACVWLEGVGNINCAP